MNEQPKNMNPYSLEDIERYLQGKLSPAEMHELEKAAVQDPFLADAIEGYQATDLTLVKQDIADLHNRLSSEPAIVIPAAAKRNNRWRVAAAILLLAGTGILGLKLFRDKSNTKELAKLENMVPLQQDTSHSAAIAGKQGIVDAQENVASQKNALAANNERMRLSLQKSVAIDNFASPEKKSLQPVAALPATPNLYNETMTAKDTALVDKIAARDMVGANLLTARLPGLAPQSNSSREVNMPVNKTFGPALAAKKENILIGHAEGSILVGAGVPVGKEKKIKRDTITLDRGEMPFLSQSGYLKLTDSAITSLSNSSALTIGGNVIGSKRGIITIDTPQLTDQKKMYITLSDITASPSAAAPRFDVTKPKEEDALSEIVITSDRRSSVAVRPIGGWYNFTKYLTDKIAAETSIKKDIDQHGTVKIKMDINESGKVSKVSILNSFNRQLNPILIKAIRKGPRWKSGDSLEKKEFIFKVDL